MSDSEWVWDTSDPISFGVGCEAKSADWYLCCLDKGHDGDHEAQIPYRSIVTGKFQVVATWPSTS